MSSSKEGYILKLYVAGSTQNSIWAINRLNNILEQEIRSVYRLKVIDVLKNPQLAEEDKISATPTLVKKRRLKFLNLLETYPVERIY